MKLSAACLSLALLAAPLPAHATDTVAAQALFARAVELARTGHWSEALEHYERSYAVKPAPETRYSIGVAQLQTGRLVAARESFLAYLAETEPDDQSAKFRTAAAEALVTIQRRVGRITIIAEPAAATVRLDGEDTPANQLVLVDPGMHVVEVAADGYAPATQTTALTTGERLDLHVALTPLTSAEPDEPAFEPAPIGLLIAGSILLSAGVTVGVVGLTRASGAEEGSGRAEDARTMAITGDVLAITGASTAVVGAIWWIVDSASGGNAVEATGLTPSPSGLVLRF